MKLRPGLRALARSPIAKLGTARRDGAKLAAALAPIDRAERGARRARARSSPRATRSTARRPPVRLALAGGPRGAATTRAARARVALPLRAGQALLARRPRGNAYGRTEAPWPIRFEYAVDPPADPPAGGRGAAEADSGAAEAAPTTARSPTTGPSPTTGRARAPLPAFDQVSDPARAEDDAPLLAPSSRSAGCASTASQPAGRLARARPRPPAQTARVELARDATVRARGSARSRRARASPRRAVARGGENPGTSLGARPRARAAAVRAAARRRADAADADAERGRDDARARAPPSARSRSSPSASCDATSSRCARRAR